MIRDPLDAAYSSFKFMEGWYLELGAVSPDDFVSQSLKRGDYYHHFDFFGGPKEITKMYFI